MGWFLGHWPSSGAPVGRPLPGSNAAERVWPHHAEVVTDGDWLPGEMRTTVRPEGRLAAFGHCLVSDDQLAASLDRCDLPATGPGACAMVAVIGDELILRGDLAGQFPVYYRIDDDRIVFSSRARLIAHSERFAPDLLWLSAKLICPDVPDAVGARTAYAGVRRLAPGATLRIGRTGERRPAILPARSPISTSPTAASTEELHDLLIGAVSARATDASALSADFSGGLDSTSLAYLASRHTPRLPVFTYHHGQAPVGDDLGRALALAADHPRFDHHLIEGTAATLPYVGLTAAPVSDEPEPTCVAPARDLLRLRAIAVTGSRVHLTGEGGDAVFAAPPGQLADLARAGDLRRFRRDATAWARLRNRAPATLMLRAVRASRTSLPQALRRLADQVERAHGAGRTTRWEDGIGYWREPGDELGWLTGRAARRLAAELRERAATAYLPDDMGVGDYASRAELAASGAAVRLLRSRAQPHGVAIHAPYLDDDVVRACLRVSARHRASPVAPKTLLRQALRQEVPARVLDRRTKGDYTAEAHLGVRAAAPALAALLAAPASADLGIIEPAPVREVLELARLGLPVPWAAFNRLLAIEVWLRAADAGHGRNPYG